jgi:outer membrane protein TolC
MTLIEPDYNNLITTIPEFLKAKYKRDMYKAINLKTKGQWLPSISLSGNIGRDKQYAIQEVFFPFDESPEHKWYPEKENWTASITLSYPLFTGGRRYFDSRIASNHLKMVSEELKNIVNSLKAKAVGVYNGLVDAVEIIEVRKISLNASKLEAEISTKKYVNGLMSYYDWRVIEDEYIKLQTELLDAERNLEQTKIDWYKFLGKSFIKDKKEGR